jgi:FixJ family two-component response regulator
LAWAKTTRLVAIVDDDPSVLKALARLLRTRSFSATTYLSGTQFLDSLAEGLPDCLILDLQMPEMTGLELQHNLTRRGIRIPTIIITAHNEAGMRERCTSGGNRLSVKAGKRYLAVRRNRGCGRRLREIAATARH